MTYDRINQLKSDTEVLKSMKKTAFLCVLLILMFCSACGNTEAPFTTEDTQESSRAGDEVPSNQNIDVVVQDKLTYSNLDSELSMNEVRDILLKSGIQPNHVDTVLNWVTDYNNSMRECPSFSLVGDFVTIDEMAVDYGEYYDMSTEWYKRNRRNYHDVVCRIAAYELNQDNISIGNVLKKENFDCWDENTAWLYTDGDILFGREAVEGEHKAYVPFPLIDWSKDMQAEYFTLFDPIGITEQCSEQEMFQAILEKWNGQEIRVNVTLPETEWLYSFIMSFGNQISILYPISLKEKIIERYKIALKHFEEDTR